MPPSPSTRVIDYDGTFFSGVQSDSYPGQVPLGSYWMGVNVLNVGGLISCRPGYRCVVTLPDGNLQGGFLFRPQIGLEQMLIGIDGRVYVANWPFTDFRMLGSLQFNPFARQLFFTQTLQSAERRTNDFTSPISVIAPKAVVFIQDGGDTAPAWYDGHEAGHISGLPYETPSGSDMVWVGDRLWVAHGNQVSASDISNPFSFRESDYLGGQVSFFFRAPVTGMSVTPSTEAPQLMVFTDVNGSLLQANIRDRAMWTATPNFQEEVIGVGCASSRSVLSHYGRLVWFSSSGIVFYDPATSGKLTTRLPVRDNELMVSKAMLSNDLSGVAIGAFGQFLMVSVPAEDRYNRHTWVLNHASLATLSDESGPSWAGYWLGTRPVAWMSGQVANVERVFHVSVDFDGKNRLWEAFIPDRMDNKCPITWGVFTRGYFGSTSKVTDKAPGVQCRLSWTDVALTGIEENLNLGVFYAGGTRGAFRQVMNKLVSVQRGSLAFDQELLADSVIYAFKAQSRRLRTEDANQQTSQDATGSCGVETLDQDNIDQDFQLLIVGHGPATLRWVRPFAFLVSEDFSGDAEACQEETPVRAVRFDGVGVKQDNMGDAVAFLAAQTIANFTSQRTVKLEQDGYMAVGVGSGESIVSQEAADRVAEIVATRMAELELSLALPPTISMGLGLAPIIFNPYLPAIPQGPSIPPNATEGELNCPTDLIAPLPNALEDHAYSQQLITGWGAIPNTFSLVSGPLPPGMVLSPSGILSGTPTEYGTFSFRVGVRDSTGMSCSQVVPIYIDRSVPNWSAISWDPPIRVQPDVGGTTIGVVSGNHFQYSVSTDHGASRHDTSANLFGRLSYTGPGTTAKLTLDVTEAGNSGEETQINFISVAVNGSDVLHLSSVTPTNPTVGRHEYTFVVPASSAASITVGVQVTALKKAFAPNQTISATGTLSNV